jgi:hypothetical protein
VAAKFLPSPPVSRKTGKVPCAQMNFGGYRVNQALTLNIARRPAPLCCTAEACNEHICGQNCCGTTISRKTASRIVGNEKCCSGRRQPQRKASKQYQTRRLVCHSAKEGALIRRMKTLLERTRRTQTGQDFCVSLTLSTECRNHPCLKNIPTVRRRIRAYWL